MMELVGILELTFQQEDLKVAGAGTVANGLFFGGSLGVQTEEYTAEVVQLGYKTISDS